MTNAHRDLHGEAYREWRDEAADDFAAAQRKAFLAGFEAAAAEGKEFQHLRTWLEEQRDEAHRQHEDRGDETYLARRLAFIEVLTKLSEMGCYPEEADEDDPFDVAGRTDDVADRLGVIQHHAERFADVGAEKDRQTAIEALDGCIRTLEQLREDIEDAD